MSYVPSSYVIPVATDPNMAGLYTKFLCHCEGADGEHVTTDSSLYSMSIGPFLGNAHTSESDFKFGNSSLYFNGPDGNGVSINNSAENIYFGNEDFTIEFWYNITSKSSPYDHWQPLICFRGTGDSYGPIILLENGGGTRVSAYISYSTNVNALLGQSSDSSLSVGVWRHFALCRDNNYLIMWIDGVLQASQRTIFRGTIVSTGPNMYIGYDPYLNRSFYGSIDEIRITCGLNRYPAGPFNTANPTNAGPFVPPTAAFSNPAAISSQAVGSMYLDGANTIYIDNATSKHRSRIRSIGADVRYLIG